MSQYSFSQARTRLRFGLLSCAAILAVSFAGCVPKQVPGEDEKGKDSKVNSAVEKERLALSWDTLKECGVGADKTYETVVPKIKHNIEDWNYNSDSKSPKRATSVHTNSTGGKWMKREGTKAMWSTMFVRYERNYRRLRGGKIDRMHSTGTGECWVTSSYAGSSTMKELQACLGILDEETVKDVHVCADPDRPGAFFWEPIIDYEVFFSGAGIPEEASSCVGVGYRSDSHLSFSADPEEAPKYRFAFARDYRWDRDESCEQYKIRADGPISLMFNGRRPLTAKDVLFNEGPLYFHSCGKTMVVPEELRQITRKGIEEIDPDVDGIYVDAEGWEPLTNFYEIPVGEEYYRDWLCLRQSTSEGAKWWPW